MGRPVAIIGSARSGTELLTELLDSHPRAHGAGEIFAAPPSVPRVPPEAAGAIARRSPLAYVAGRAALSNLRGHPMWSFKLLFHQLRWFEASCFGSAPEFLQCLRERGFILVVLERRNTLLQALSLLHAMRTQYHFRDHAPYEPLEVDPVELVWALHELDFNARWGRFMLGDLPRIELTYEDDLVSPERQLATAERIFVAAGVEPRPPTSSLRQVAPGTVRERISNYDDVVATLATTRYAEFLG